MAGCCNQPIFGVEVVDCQLLFSNESGYILYTFELEDLRLDQSNMPLELTLFDGVSQIMLRAENFDTTIIPITYATLDELSNQINVWKHDCYCPC